jgi:hypothetical protein
MCTSPSIGTAYFEDSTNTIIVRTSHSLGHGRRSFGQDKPIFRYTEATMSTLYPAVTHKPYTSASFKIIFNHFIASPDSHRPAKYI